MLQEHDGISCGRLCSLKAVMTLRGSSAFDYGQSDTAVHGDAAGGSADVDQYTFKTMPP